MEEIWKSVGIVKGIDFTGLYEASNLGYIRSIDSICEYIDGRKRHLKGRVLRPSIDKKGYSSVTLYKNGLKVCVRVHRLVLQTFEPNPNPEIYTEINHIDENKKNNCLCPYCLKQTLYFDNDYIPMNYTFIKLASIYYGISSLGCSFREIKKILKKHIVVVKKLENNFLDFANIIEDPKIKPIDEKIIARKLYLLLENQELNLEHRITLVIPNIIDNKNLFLEIMLVTFMETLANTVYLSQINLFFKDKNLEDIWKKKIKEVLSF